MKKLYAPWRSKYVDKNVHQGKSENTQKDECIFCKKIKANNDEKHYILKRSKNAAIILNLYPYNAGHIMVIPLQHKKSLEDLSSEVRYEIIDLITKTIETLKKTIKPDGFNVGINLGKHGGAGIPSHLHVHIVPRWNGDTNFLPIISNTKAISFDLNKIYKDLRKSFDKLK